MAGFDTILISRIQQANDIVDVIGEHLSLKRKGREMVGLCPFHDDHTPSFNVNPSKQIFKCFACGAGGDVVKFVQMREGLSFPQALERLAERAGIKIDRRPKTADQRPKTEEADPNELARVNAWAAKYFAANLTNPEKGKEARQYLEQRKLSRETIEKWQIGLSPASGSDLLTAARRAKIPDRLLTAAGLVVGSGLSLADKFVNRLMFTICNETGRVIGFGGRTLAGGAGASVAKYINSPTTILFDKSNAMFGLNNARHAIGLADTAVVVEGYTDCIMAHQFGVANVVATLGTSFTAGHARIIRRFAKKVVLLFDSDTAGQAAANRALQVALGSRIDIAIANVPEGKDPCDFLLARGKEAFEETIEKATDVFKFKWDRLSEKLGSQATIAGKKQAVDEYFDAIATAISAGNVSVIERGLYTNLISSIIKIGADEINRELNKRISRAKTASQVELHKASPALGEGLSAGAQREILEVLLAEPKLFKNVKKAVSAEDFDVVILNHIAQAIFQMLSVKPGADSRDICGLIEEPEIASLILELEKTGLEKGNFERRLAEATAVLEQIRKEKANTGEGTKDIRGIFEAAKRDQRNMGMV